MSAIYYDQESEIKANQCKTILIFNNTPESKILDARNVLILLNLQKPWTIACKDVSRVFEIEYSTYHILNRLMDPCPNHIVCVHLPWTILSSKAPEASVPDHIYTHGHLTQVCLSM